MKVRFACTATLLLAASTSMVALAQRGGPRGKDRPDAGRNAWLSSFDEGMAESRRTGKPLMVVIRCQP